MRFVLCDEDQLFVSLMEAMLADIGHEVVGVATNTPDAVALLEAALPDVVIVDLALGFNTDFDVVSAAGEVGATVIAFTQNADEVIVRQYAIRPTVVFKPDLQGLERVIRRLEVDGHQQVVEHDRREHAGRVLAGREPTGVSDAQAFYEALNEAVAGDALVSIQVPDCEGIPGDASDTALRVRGVMRDGDRLLASQSVLRVLLPVGEDIGAASFLGRLEAVDALTPGTVVRSIVIEPGESAAEAFNRLKAAGLHGSAP